MHSPRFRFLSLFLALAPVVLHAAPPHLLVFSKTAGFRHSSIPTGIAALARMGDREGWQVTFTEDARTFTAERLAPFDAVCFLNTTGDVLKDDQMAALRTFITSGHGFTGVHAATDTEAEDPWYPGMIGATFSRHPKQQAARIIVNHDRDELGLVSHLGPDWTRFDEWYEFRGPVVADACVLLELDDSSYSSGQMGSPHPSTWTRREGDGRVFYTGLGHTEAAYEEPAFVELLRRGLTWTLATNALDAATDWRPLLDPELSQWEPYLGVPHGSLGLAGVPADSDGRTGTALGLNHDPLGVFQMIEQNGEPVLAVSGQIFGGLTSRESFSNYHLRLQFKWGDRKWEPRLDKERDSGVLYHCTGPHGAFWNVWKRCLEFQILEGGIGDYYGLAGTAVMAAATKPVGSKWTYTPDATPVLFQRIAQGNGTYVRRRPDVTEQPHGGWNTLELYTVGRDAVHMLNGEIVNVVRDAAWVDAEGVLQPLAAGQIQLQSEAAECYFRRVEIRPIDAFPAALQTRLAP